MFAFAGLCGVTLYFLFENIALTYTMASNVGVMVSVAPFFTALLAHRFLNGEKLRLNFFIGFAAAILGIGLINFNGVATFKLFLGLIASAVCFAAWSYCVKKLGAVTTSVYIYLVPVVSVICSALMLGEPITLMSASGTLLTLAGLFISERRISFKKAKASAAKADEA